jgi:tetratricopeptide (TPR) repeat protein
LTEALDIEDPARRAREARSGSPKAGEREQADRSFRAGRFEEAAVVYQRLVEQHPADPALRASLAGALGAGSRYEDALKQLEVAIRLAPLDPTSRHNRGAVFERLGRPKEAIEQYRAAVRYSPGYEPSRRALLRLTGSEEPDPPRTAEERRARELADEASEAARQRDYPRARDLLDQAQRLAPRYALVYQYRSNVLYLMGDSAAAARALERALALDPDNALYARNLQGLRQRGRPERP